jgi:hypothetical protein
MERPKPSWFIISVIAGALLFFFSIPLFFIAYAAAGGLAGGLAIIGLLILLQAPGYLMLKWSGILSEFPMGKPKDE